MRIAFFAPEFYPPWGGVGTYSIQLIREMSKLRNTEIHVFTPRRGADYDPKKVLGYFGDRITLHNISVANDTFVYNYLFQKALGAQFASFNALHRYDITHAANLVHMPDIALKFRKSDIPSVVTAHTTIGGQVSGFLRGNKNFLRMAPSEKGSIMLYPLISSLEWWYLRKTPNLISISEKFKALFEKRGYSGDIRVIHNGIDLKQYDYEKTKFGKSRFDSLSRMKDPIVLYAGRLVSQKGIGLFVEMMRRIIAEGEPAHFVIAGHGDDKTLRLLLKEAGIPDGRVSILGFVPNLELPWLYKAASVFVLPSFYENFPISLMEAMAMRCPCVATDVGAVSELVSDGNDGFVVAAGDIDALTAKTRLLLSDAGMRERFGRSAQKKVRASFSAQKMASRTREYYEAIIGKKA